MTDVVLSVDAALEDLNATIEASMLEITALENIEKHGQSPALEGLFADMGHPGIHALHAQISEEGVVDFVKEKLSKLTNKLQIFANSVYAKFKSQDDEIHRKIAEARASGNGEGLPIGKVASVITAIGAAAGIAAAATLGGKALASNSGDIKAKAAEIRKAATRKKEDIINSIKDQAAKHGVIKESALQGLWRRTSSDARRGLQDVGAHLSRYKGEYAAAAAVTGAVAGSTAFGLKAAKDVKAYKGAMGYGTREAGKDVAVDYKNKLVAGAKNVFSKSHRDALLQDRKDAKQEGRRARRDEGDRKGLFGAIKSERAEAVKSGRAEAFGNLKGTEAKGKEEADKKLTALVKKREVEKKAKDEAKAKKDKATFARRNPEKAAHEEAKVARRPGGALKLKNQKRFARRLLKGRKEA